MNPDELPEILECAFKLPPAQRDDFLREACRGDEQMRAEALRLLPYYEPDPNLEMDGPFSEPWQVPVGPDLHEGQRIHEYILKRKCGSGGMGDVWEADQVEPFSRRVALKIVQRTTTWHVEAFHAEREMLAKLEHPYIARIYGGDEGRWPAVYGDGVCGGRSHRRLLPPE
jgi:serine/threonine protein kinase